jgi:MinD-like ATPase involved in chromosome partitioning or flagellar assembly
VSVPLRIVFASLKGGVGRSTALAVVASDLAARGRNILVIDLDLEAPGLGALLLPDDRMPRFGVLDYLVENGIGGISNAALSDFIGASPLTTSGGGRVDVVPVFGNRSAECYENILPKLARAMTEDVNEEGKVTPVGAQISEMIDRLSTRESYDIVLIDSRAGLAEVTAPAVLGLGALVLLFGTAQQQTIIGYRALFSGLKLLAMRAVERGDSADWRLMFKPVYAKASLDSRIGARHAAELYELFADNLYDPASSDVPAEGQWNFLADDPMAPHAPLTIPFDPRFVDFDPLRNQGHLAKAFYEQTFRPFLDGLDSAMNDLTQDPERAAP